jgi:hypothetical protein
MPTDMTSDGAHAADFRMLIIIRATMRPSQSAIVSPPPLVLERERRGVGRRLLREFARPFEWIGKAVRRSA